MNYTIQLIFLLLSLGFFTSCSKSSPSKCGENFFLYTAVSDEVQAFSQAALAYSENPTESNCEKYRTAVHNYITALESWEDCAKEYGEIEDWRQSLKEAREDADQMDCK